MDPIFVRAADGPGLNGLLCRGGFLAGHGLRSAAGLSRLVRSALAFVLCASMDDADDEPGQDEGFAEERGAPETVAGLTNRTAGPLEEQCGQKKTDAGKGCEQENLLNR